MYIAACWMGINWISFTVIFKIYLKIFLSKAINRLKEKKRKINILPMVTGAEVGLKPLTFWMKRRVFYQCAITTGHHV
jgi:hypothetical protein